MTKLTLRLHRRRGAGGVLGPAVVAVYLMALGGLVLAGPYGIFSFGESAALLSKRQMRIAALEKERAELKNRVGLLDRDNADPDLVTELIRRDLNVAHPDEYVIELAPSQR